MLPYYTKLQEYSDVDHRDIWEYPLNLTGPEIRKMMLHIREMDGIASDYYFFDENCSYDLLFLLEAARPSVKLTDQVHAWLIPLDSVRMVEQRGFHYRCFLQALKDDKDQISCISFISTGTGQGIGTGQRRA